MNLPANFSLPLSVLSSSDEETFTLGFEFSKILEKGSIVALKGILGAGKTVFVKGVGKGLGILEVLTSPTYNIVSEYEGYIRQNEPVSVFHIDAYRLGGIDDFSAIGGEEIIYGNGISLIEWYDRIDSLILPQAIKIDITVLDNDKRKILIYRVENEHTGP